MLTEMLFQFHRSEKPLRQFLETLDTTKLLLNSKILLGLFHRSETFMLSEMLFQLMEMFSKIYSKNGYQWNLIGL